MNKHWFLLLLLSFFCQSSFAIIADCKETDLNDAESVWRCFGTYRYAPGGRLVVESSLNLGCSEVAGKFKDARVRSGIRGANAYHAPAPSCTILAQVSEKFLGAAPWWKYCIGKPEKGAHLKNCLEAMALAYYQKPIASLGGCQQMLRSYMIGIKSGNLNASQDLLNQVNNITCDDVHAVLAAHAPKVAAKWTPCMNYDPKREAEHVLACIGSQTVGLTNCPQVRTLYESKIAQANGGRLPAGYVSMDCAVAKPIIQAELKRIEAARIAARKRAQAARNRPVQSYTWNDLQKDLGLGGHFLTPRSSHGLSGFISASFWYGLVCVSGLYCLGYFIAWKKRQAREWIGPGIFEQRFNIKSKALTLVVFLLGWGILDWFFLIGGIIGAIIMAAVGKVLWFFRFFDNPPLTAPPVASGKAGPVQEQPPSSSPSSHKDEDDVW